MILNVEIKNNVATYIPPDDEKPVCGNGGNKVKFTFDEEWEGHEKKTARFGWSGHYFDKEFEGDTVDVPVITNATKFTVGVYVGEPATDEDEDVLSTTKATIPCRLSVRCDAGGAHAGTGANYTNEARGYAAEAKAAAAEAEASVVEAEAIKEQTAKYHGMKEAGRVELSTYTEDQYIALDGQILDSVGHRLSAPIKITHTEIYISGVEKTYSLTDTLNFYSCDIVNQFHFVGSWRQDGSDLQKVSIPEGAEYVVVCYASALWETVNLYFRGVERDLLPQKSIKSIMRKVVSRGSDEQPVKIKLIGDSITHGMGGTGFTNDAEHGEHIYGSYYVNTDGHCWANSLKSYLESKFNCTVSNFGTTGRDSDNIVTYFDSLVKEDDDIVVCSIGTNDRPNGTSSAWGGEKNAETIYRSLNSIYAKCKKAGKDIIFISPIPCSVAGEETTPRHTEDIDHIFLKLSCDCHFEYISMHQLFIDYCDYTGVTIDSLLSDGLHPNDNGYDVMFRLICNALCIKTKRAGATW